MTSETAGLLNIAGSSRALGDIMHEVCLFTFWNRPPLGWHEEYDVLELAANWTMGAMLDSIEFHWP